jgi:hypothetical protein
VAGIADGDFRIAVAEGRDHAEVQLVHLARVGRGGMGDHEAGAVGMVAGAHGLHRVDDLLQRGHAGGNHQRPAGGTGLQQQGDIGQGGAGHLVERRFELLDEIHRRLVPAGGGPVDPEFPAITVDLFVFVEAEFHPAAVVDVGHPAPGRIALQMPLIHGHAEFGGALLELHAIGAGAHRAEDEFLRGIHGTVVVDADLGDDVNRMAVADHALADGHCPFARSDTHVLSRF